MSDPSWIEMWKGKKKKKNANVSQITTERGSTGQEKKKSDCDYGTSFRQFEENRHLL